jgi:Sortase domain
MSRVQRNVLAAVGVVLALSGTTLIAVAMAPQDRAPLPPMAVVSSDRPLLSPLRVGPSSDPTGSVMSRSRPVSIDIPSIGVRSSLLSLGVNADKTVQVPSGAGYDQAGWYRYSPTPGSLGPAVILGHVSGTRGASVFYELGRLRPGDRVRVTRRDGSVAIFEVARVRRYPKDRFPTQLVYGNTDHPALRLITCGGLFDSTTGHFVDNVVVFASLVGSR